MVMVVLVVRKRHVLSVLAWQHLLALVLSICLPWHSHLLRTVLQLIVLSQCFLMLRMLLASHRRRTLLVPKLFILALSVWYQRMLQLYL